MSIDGSSTFGTQSTPVERGTLVRLASHSCTRGIAGYEYQIVLNRSKPGISQGRTQSRTHGMGAARRGHRNQHQVTVGSRTTGKFWREFSSIWAEAEAPMARKA